MVCAKPSRNIDKTDKTTKLQLQGPSHGAHLPDIIIIIIIDLLSLITFVESIISSMKLLSHIHVSIRHQAAAASACRSTAEFVCLHVSLNYLQRKEAASLDHVSTVTHTSVVHSLRRYCRSEYWIHMFEVLSDTKRRCVTEAWDGWRAVCSVTSSSSLTQTCRVDNISSCPSSSSFFRSTIRWKAANYKY